MICNIHLFFWKHIIAFILYFDFLIEICDYLQVPSLSKEGAPLIIGLTEGKDYEKLPPCLWRALLRWHGSAVHEGISLPRRVIPLLYVEPFSSTPNKSVIELYPPSLLILRHGTASGGWLQSALGLFFNHFFSNIFFFILP